MQITTRFCNVSMVSVVQYLNRAVFHFMYKLYRHDAEIRYKFIQIHQKYTNTIVMDILYQFPIYIDNSAIALAM